MSKGRVWNKGKRNGGGGPVEGNKELAQAKEAKKLGDQQPEASPVLPNNDEANNPINRVTRMNRENWVERPVRVKPQDRN
jgi:hypothetical protein